MNNQLIFRLREFIFPNMGSKKRLSLRVNFSWTFVGNGIYALAQWGILVVLAKYGNAEMVGQFALGFAITAPIIIFFNLQLRNVLATDSKNEYSFNNYFGLRILAVLSALLIITTLLLFLNYTFEKSFVIWMIGLSKVVDSLSDIFFGLFQQQERMDYIAKSRIMNGILSFCSVFVCMILFQNLFISISSFVIASVLVFILYDIKNGARIYKNNQDDSNQTSNIYFDNKSIKPQFYLLTVWPIIKRTLPLGIVGLLISLNTNIPNYFIGYHLGESELGIYAAMFYLFVAGNVVTMALGQAGSPRLAELFSNGKYDLFHRLLLKLIFIGLSVGILGIVTAKLFGEQLLSLLYNAEFAQHSQVLFVVMIVACISYVASFLSFGMMATRKFSAQLPLYIIVTLSVLFGCLVFVPAFNLYGALLALAISFSIQAIGSILVIKFAMSHQKKILL